MKTYLYYTVYKITHKETGKIYYGAHRTNNLNEGYMGSGKWIRRAVEKYGKESFFKEILYIFDNEKEMLDMEEKIVGDSVVESCMFYNLKRGGISSHGEAIFSEGAKEKLREVKKNRKWIYNPQTLCMKQPPLEELEKYLDEGWLLGRAPHTTETKEKISKANKGIKRDEEWVKRNKAMMLKEWADPLKRQIRIESSHRFWSDPNRPNYKPSKEAIEKARIRCKGCGSYMDKDGNFYKVPTNDPRVISGELFDPKKGCIWVFNIETENACLIKPELWEDYKKKGYIKGRGWEWAPKNKREKLKEIILERYKKG